MKYCFREKEINMLNNLANEQKNACGSILIHGNRKTGKTELIKQFLKQNKGIYLTLSTNTSKQQLEDITSYLRTTNQFSTYVPYFRNWKELFDFFFFISQKEKYFLVVDEFHNFDIIEKSIFTEIKHLYEKYKDDSKLTIVFISSNKKSINKNIKSQNAALYSFNNAEIILKPFNLSNVFTLYKNNKSKLANREIVKIYLIFGGLPKYYTLIDNYSLWNSNVVKVIEKLVLHEYAPLGFEFKELILNEFNKSNKTYLAILQAIANGKNTISEIAEDIHVQSTTLMKYLNELSYAKNLITRKTPIHLDEDESSKHGRYFINSYFENFWFRFIQPNQIYFELHSFDNLLNIIKDKIDDYLNERFYSIIKEIFTNDVDHKIIKELFPYQISAIGAFWNRKHKFDIGLISNKEAEILLFKSFLYDEEISLAEVELLNKSLKELKSTYKTFNIKTVLISNKKLKNSDLGLIENTLLSNIQVNEVFNNLS